MFIRNLETGAETTIQSTKRGYEDYPSFSKDGRRVSFTGGRLGSREVYTWDWEKGEVRRVTRGHDYVGSTNFSADGKKIVYHAYYGESYGSERADIFVVDADGSAVRGENITRNDDVWVYKAQWSPDGDWIAFSARYDTPNFNLWVMRPDGSDRTRITDVRGEDFRWADWTEDGRLAWHGTVAQRGYLYAIEVATGTRHEMIARNDYVRSLGMAPDGTTLVLETMGDVLAVDAVPGSMPLVLASGNEPRISRDGRMVTFLHDRRRRVAEVPLAGGEVRSSNRQPGDREPASEPSPRSPDGSWRVDIEGSQGLQDIVLIRSDGTRRRITSDGHPKSSPTWSSDGRFVYYAQNEPSRVVYYISERSVSARLSRALAAGR